MSRDDKFTTAMLLVILGNPYYSMRPFRRATTQARIDMAYCLDAPDSIPSGGWMSFCLGPDEVVDHGIGEIMHPREGGGNG